jgi:glycosyltransferase involved in cell wall biosynthesis
VRVALLVTDLQRGGTPLRLAAIARGLCAAGVEVAVGCLAPRGPVSERLAADGVATFACDARGPRDFRALSTLRAQLRMLRPDVLHSTLTHANVAARLIGPTLRIPVLTSTATIEVERPAHLWAERLTGRFDRGHIVNSNALATHVRRAFRVPPGRVYVVPPFLDPFPRPPERSAARAALDISPHEFVIAWAGRFDPVKRLDRLIECAELMGDAPVRFLVAGDGPLRSRIETLLRISSAQRHVQLLGWVPDPAPVFAAADAAIFPSLTEGLPNAALQAMACGVAVVGSDIAAFRELSCGGERLLIAPGEAAQDYAAALRQVRDNPARRRALGERAARWAADNLDIRKTISALLDVYHRVARRRT